MNRINDLILSRVIFGAMSYPGHRTSERIRVLHCAIDHGITSIDTAPLYNAGESEEIVGAAIADRRESVQILTKCGLCWDDNHGAPMFRMNVNGEPRVVRKDSRPNSIVKGIDQSLRRLRIETIDLIQIHQLDIDTPLSETLEVLQSAQQAGKIRAIGVSNFPIGPTIEAYDLLSGDLFSTQNRFSLVDRAHIEEIQLFAAQKSVALLAYSPLAQGVLTGKYFHGASRPEDGRANSHYLSERNLNRINNVLEQHALPLARGNSTNVSAVSLAWVLAQPGITSVIAGASTERQCIENATAANLTLPASDLQRLGDAMAACRIHKEGRAKRIVRRLAQRSLRAAKRLAGV